MDPIDRIREAGCTFYVTFKRFEDPHWQASSRPDWADGSTPDREEAIALAHEVFAAHDEMVLVRVMERPNIATMGARRILLLRPLTVPPVQG